jgi:hypothetical protein
LPDAPRQAVGVVHARDAHARLPRHPAALDHGADALAP